MTASVPAIIAERRWWPVVPTTVIRVVLGVLWLHEGFIKYRAGFGRADIGLVVDSVAANSRVPVYFSPVVEQVLGRVPTLFGILMPAMEVALGIVVVIGLWPRWAAFVSIVTLMTYWSADQLTDVYPVMVVLAAAVLMGGATVGVDDLRRRRIDSGSAVSR